VAITDVQQRLLDAVTQLRDRIAATHLPLEAAGVEQARTARDEITGQLDDYVLPRLRKLDAPLLTVVGGSTGAGKSTLLNSLVRKEISAPGVLRPTTRSPVLACHPSDARWFADQRILPSLARSTGATGDPGTLHIVRDNALPSGLALLDAPDIDSVVKENRQLAAQLLAAADLWLFVTTAARYADAVPWDLLRIARERSTALAVVLNRVPVGAEVEVTQHLATMLSDHGLGGAPLFVIPEAQLADGLLPHEVIAPVRGWLTGLSADAEARNAVVRRTLAGALDSLRGRVPALAAAAEAQVKSAHRLQHQVQEAYATAVQSVDDAMTDGSLLRGEVLARWQEFVGTGEILRSLEARIGQIRDRVAAALTGRPQPGSELREALESSVEALVLNAADRAAERSASGWNADPAGRALIARASLLYGDDLSRVSSQFPDAVAVMVREWQGYVLELVRSQGADKRTTARFLSYGVNGTGLLLMLVVFAHTGGLTGAEVGVAGGTSLLSQKILEAVFGDQAVRQLAADARHELTQRVNDLLAREQRRFTSLLSGEDVRPGDAAALHEALRELDEARKAAAATEGTAASPAVPRRRAPERPSDRPEVAPEVASEAEREAVSAAAPGRPAGGRPLRPSDEPMKPMKESSPQEQEAAAGRRGDEPAGDQPGRETVVAGDEQGGEPAETAAEKGGPA
jgi:hypothetical protein